MEQLMQPVTPHITVLINGIPVGALLSYSEKTERKIQTMRALGSAENQSLYIGTQTHTVHLRYLMPPASELCDGASDPHSLQNFSLRIDTPDRALCFDQCEYGSMQTGCDVGGGIVCEAVIYALGREVEEVQ